MDVYIVGRTPSTDTLDSYTLSFELVYRDVVALQTLGENHAFDLSVCEVLVHALNTVVALKEVEEQD